MGSVLWYLSLLVISGQVFSQSNCPAKDTKCYCETKFNRYHYIYCKGLVSSLIPTFNPSQTEYTELSIRDGSKVNEIQNDAFTNVRKVRGLMLQSLGIRTIRDGAFRGLEDTLTQLHLDDNELTTVPSRALRGLKKLAYLALPNNKITRLEADAFSGLPSLWYIYMFGNGINYVSPDAFRGLNSIQGISLHRNKIRTISSQTFDQLGQLRELELQHNNLTSLDPALFRSTNNLERLDLSNNELAFLQSNTFPSISRLRNLNLGYNRLETIELGTFNGLGELKYLYLNGNQLSLIYSGIFSPLSKLNSIYLHDNLLSELPVNLFSSLSELRQLHIYSNRLTTFLPDVFNGLPKVWDLNLAYNRIVNLGNSPFQRLVSLEYLDLQGNFISSFSSDNLGGLSKIRLLQLQNNSLTSLTSNSFGSVPSLTRLSLGANQISDINKSAFRGLNNLKSLELHNNSLSVLQDGIFTNNRQLQNLKLSNNQLSSYSRQTWNGLGQLKHLYLDGNRISTLPADGFSPLFELIRVFLQGNIITRVDERSFHKLRNLEHIDLCDNQISVLEPYCLDYQKKLLELKLCNNKLSSLDTHSLASLREVTDIDLSNNLFRTLTNPPFVQDLKALESINLEGNPLVCDCNNAWMRTFLPVIKGMEKDPVFCHSSGPYYSQKMLCYPVDRCPGSSNLAVLPEAKDFCEKKVEPTTRPTTRPTLPPGSTVKPTDFPTVTGPFVCNFDQGLCQFRQIGGQTGTNYFGNEIKDKQDWIRQSGTTPSQDTGPSGDHTSGKGWYMFMEASDPVSAGDVATLLLSININTPSCLKFYYHMLGKDIGTLRVRVKTSGPAVTKWSKGLAAGTSTAWHYGQVNLETGYQVLLFDGIRGGGFAGDIALDDVSITAGECPTEPGDGCPGLTCKNGGSCLHTPLFDSCQCPSWTEGQYCQITGNPCDSSPCGPNSVSCQNLLGGTYECTCRPGWRGAQCRDQVDPCLSNPCGPNSISCQNLQNGQYQCQCSPGWQGPQCRVQIDPCLSNPCGSNSVSCQNIGGIRYECRCRAGWQGERCTVQVDPCQSGPCLNGATCNRQGVTGYTCRCPTGYTGTRCESEIDPCTSNPCQNGGQCLKDGFYRFRCNCPSNYQGVFCESLIDPCQSGPCKNGGSCTRNGVSYFCKCTDDWSGTNCINYVDPCVSNPCLNNGQCQRLNAQTFQCQCQTGFSGDRCQNTLSGECRRRPCQNGGSCYSTPDTASGYVCVCPIGYSGPQCTSGANPCSSSPCRNNARCYIDGNSYYCRCPPGYSGIDCSARQAACASSPCLFGGICTETPSGGFTCKCTAGYTGKHCHQAVNLPNLPVRLTGSGRPYEGRLEVYHNGEWGTVCNDGFDSTSAEIVCSAMGYTGGFIYNGPSSSNQFQKIWLDGLKCDYKYPSLMYCGHNQLGVHNCQHSQDISVRCNQPIGPPTPPPVTVRPPTSPPAGPIFECNFESGICLDQESGDDFDWTRKSGSTPSGSTGPKADHTTGSGYYMFSEASSPRKTGEKTILGTPSFPVQNTATCLRFWYHMYGSGIGQLSVTMYYSATNRQVWAKSGDQGQNWLQAEVTLLPAVFKVTWTADLTGNYRGDIAIDDVSISRGSCSGVVPPPVTPPTTSIEFLTTSRPVDKLLAKCDFDQDACPGVIVQSNQDKFDWTLRKGKTPSSGTGPSQDHSGTGSYMYIEASSPRRKDEEAVLIIKTNKNSLSKCLEIWYHMHGGHIGSLRVEGVTSPGSTVKQTLLVLTGAQGDAWLKNRMDVSGSVQEVSIIGVRGSDYQGDISIDDITLETGKCDGTQGVTPPTPSPVGPTPAPSSGTPAPATSLWKCDFESTNCAYLQNTAGDKFDWSRRTGRTLSSDTGPSSARGSATGHYMYTEASSPQTDGDNAILESQRTSQVTPLMCLKFWFHMYGNGMGTFNVFMNNPTGGTRSLVWSKTGNQGNTWHQGLAPIEAPQQNFQVYLEGVVDDYTSDIAVDDVELNTGPCYDMNSAQSCDFEKGDCFLHESGVGDVHWMRRNQRYQSDTGPSSGNNQAGYFMVLPSNSAKSGSTAALESPLVPAGATRCLRFYYHMYGSGIGSLTISVVSGSSANIWTRTGNQGDRWLQANVEVSSQFRYKVRITASVASTGVGDLALDDVTLTIGRC